MWRGLSCQSDPSAVIAAAAKVLYLIFLLSAALAGRYRYKTMETLALVRNCSRSALQLHTMAVIQDMEAYILEMEVTTVEREVQKEASEAQRYFYDSQVEENLAEREKLRAEYFQNLAEQDQGEANRAKLRVRHDEALYAKLIANMTAGEEEANLREKNLRTIHTGVCGTAVFSTLCNVVEGAVDLQRQADQESLVIQQELLAKQEKRKDALSRREFMDQLVAEALQQKATHLNQTSQYLFDTSAHFQNQSQQFYYKAQVYNQNVEELMETEEEIKEQEERDERWEEGNMSMAEQRLLESQTYYKAARKYATTACLLAAPSILFFLVQVVQQAWYVGISFSTGSKSESPSPSALHRCISKSPSYCLLHVADFLICIGFISKLLINMHYYDWGQRAAIVAWFSFLAALLQVICLHALPLVVRADCHVELLRMFEQALVVFLPLACMFAIEFLLAWIMFGSALQTASTLLGHWLLRVVAAGLLALHVGTLDPCSQETHPSGMVLHMTQADETSQLTESWNLSETTPLTGLSTSKSSASASSRAAMLAFALTELAPWTSREHAIGREPHVTSLLIDLGAEFYRLRLPFEILILACSTKVFFTCLPIARQHVVLFCSLALILMSMGCTWQCMKLLPYDKRQRLVPMPLNENGPKTSIELSLV